MRALALDAAADAAALHYLGDRRGEGAAGYADAWGMLDEMEERELMDLHAIRLYRIKLALFEGVYLMMHGSWAAAKKKFEFLISTLTTSSDDTETLAGSKMMYGWCCYHLGDVDGSIVVFESSLQCYDATQSVSGKALTLSNLAYITLTQWRQQYASASASSPPPPSPAGDPPPPADDGLLYSRELLGECFTLGADNDVAVLQILALESLVEIHEEVGEGDIAAELSGRALKLRGGAGDEAGKNEMLEKMEIKKARGGMDVGGSHEAPAWMD